MTDAQEHKVRDQALAAPHAQRPEVVADALRTNADLGLTTGEAAARLRRFGPNEITEAPGPSRWEQLLDQFRSPLVYLLGAAIVVSLVAWLLDDAGEAPVDVIAIAAIMVVNAAIGFVQERRAEVAIAELRAIAASTATVIRDGSAASVLTTELVPGDLIVIREGDTVPADGRLVETRGLALAEAALTGESEPVHKAIAPTGADAGLGDRTSMVFATTDVARGSGRAIVTSTGMNTEVGGIASLLGATLEPPTPLEREIGRVGRVLGTGVVAIAIAVVAVTFAVSGVDSTDEAVELLLIGVSLAVAAVPEGLPAVLSLVLAVGVRRMAARNALLKRLAFAETLGSTTVICTDKTGTLTRNEMTTRRLATPTGQYLISGTGYGPEGAIVGVDGEAPSLDEIGRHALAFAVWNSSADVRNVEGDWQAVGDPTEAALVAAATRAGIDPTVERTNHPRVDELPFDSARKRLTTLHHDPDRPGRYLAVTKGAPDVLVPLCNRQGWGAHQGELTDTDRARWDGVVDGFADEAMRTLAVAARRLDDHHRAELTADDEQDLSLLAVFGIIDPPREGVGEAVREAQDAGIRVVMITGDHPRTATQIAREVHIAGEAATVTTGADIDAGLIDLDEAAATTSVFSRVAPRHKLDLVEALQAQGHIVAMTGDGVNDAPALKAAEIGVAMGIAGSDVSRGAADMILTDDNFATIIAAVEEGRSILDNVSSFLRYLVSSNVGEVLTMFFGVVLAGVIGLESGAEGIIVPLTAAQILWINLLTDTGPALALGLDRLDTSVMRRGPRPPGTPLIDRTMLATIGIIGITMAAATLVMLDAQLPGGLVDGSADQETARTAAFTVLVMAQLFNAFNARSATRSAFASLGQNGWLVAMAGVSLGLQLLVVHTPFLNDAFETTPLSFATWMWCTVLASSVLWVAEIQKVILRRGAETHRHAAIGTGHGQFPDAPLGSGP